MRATTARRPSSIFSHQVTPKQLADSVLHALHGEQGAPANPPPRRWSAPSGCGACVCW